MFTYVTRMFVIYLLRSHQHYLTLDTLQNKEFFFKKYEIQIFFNKINLIRDLDGKSKLKIKRKL
jgi:hypothetical protein